MTELGRPRAAALVSGGGSTVLNLIDHDRRGELAVSIALVVAHREDNPAIERCRALGVPVTIIPGPACPGASDQLDALLVLARIDLVLLCGYLRYFRVGPWRGRTLNVHPALLPAFGGAGMHGDHVHAAVLHSGVRESGCTVHQVDEEYDHGEAILRRTVPVEPGDTVATLGERVRAAERLAYPEAISRWVQGRR